MKFFSKLFYSIKNRPSINFFFNIFFLRQMLSLNLNHVLIPHYFLPVKTLKIKFLHSYSKNYWIYVFIYLIFIFFNLFIFIILNFSRPMVRITGFHPVDPGSIPG